MAELLQVENLSAGYGEAVVLHGVSLSLDEGETLALLGRNGTGKTTLINTLVGATRQHGGTHRARRRGAAQAAVARARRRRHRLGAAGAQHLQVAHGGREPDRRGAPRAGAVDAGARLRDVPAPGRAQDQPGHAALGRRAADAGRGPRAGAQPARCCCWTSRSKAWRPSSWRSCCAPSRRITRDEGLSAIIVEQHPQAILAISDTRCGAGPRHRGACRHGREPAASSPSCWTDCWAWPANRDLLLV